MSQDYRKSSSDGLSVVLYFAGEEAWRIRFSGVRHASLRWGASDADESCWRQLRKPRRKIPGDKKHAEGLSLRVLTLRSSIQHINSVAAAAKGEVPLFRKYESLLAPRAVADKYQKTSRLSPPSSSPPSSVPALVRPRPRPSPPSRRFF